MKKTLFIIFGILFTARAFAGYGGNIGILDDRIYSSLSNPEYYGVVKLYLPPNKNRCTGTFISDNLIITNTHCALHCKQGECSAEFWDGSKFTTSSLKLVAINKNAETLNGKDWAILSSDQKNPMYRKISPQSTPGPVLRGGFGTLRIIQNDEIPFLKSLYAKTKSKFKAQCKGNTSCINRHVNEQLVAMGKEPLFGDTDKFKIQHCNILHDYPNHPKMVTTDCDSAGGDSGAALLRNNNIVGLNNSGPQNVFNNNEAKGATAVKTDNFYTYTQKLIQKRQNNSGVTHNNSNNNNNISNANNNHSNNNSNTVDEISKPNENNTPTLPSNTNNTVNNTEPGAPIIINNSDEQQINETISKMLESFDCD